MPLMQQQRSQKSFKKIGLPHPTIIFFIVTRYIAIIFSTPSYSDIDLFFKNFFTNGQILGLSAYRDFAFEYPPLSLIPIYLPKLFLSNPTLASYFLVYALAMFCADLACLLICRAYCKNRLSMSQNQINYMTLLYGLFGFLLFKLIYHRLDILASLFIAASLILFRADKSKLSPTFFTNSLLGFFYKIIPAFNAPIAIIFKAFDAHKNSSKIFFSILRSSVIFLSCVVFIIVALQIHSKNNFVKNMMRHQERGIQIESTIGSFLLFKRMIFNQPSAIGNAYGSWDIDANLHLESATKSCGILILLGFYSAIFFTLLNKKNRAKKPHISEENFLEATLITILLTLAFQRVLSPQFFIWLAPIAAIWLTKNRSIKNLIAFSFLFLATFFIFSIDYFSLLNQEPITISVLFLRNIILIVLTCVITKNFFKKLSANA